MEQAIAEFINAHFFSLKSVILHTIWFAIWLTCKLDINLLTLIVSLEAIYITLFLGLGSKDHHEKTRQALKEQTPHGV